MASRIILPYNYKPRHYQVPIFQAIDNGKKRAILISHRRSGKDKTLLNLMIKKMFERVGIYFYFLPTYKQAKKVIWDNVDGDGFKFTDHFPPSLIAAKNETELKITMKNSSVFQLIGTDDWDGVMGTNPVGCVFSEFSLQNPAAWDYIRPILRENGGWAIFNYTPRGQNHAFDLYNMAKNNDDWFVQLSTVNDTKREDGLPVISQKDIDDERKEGMDEDLIQQEYYCSFSASITGAFYSKQMAQAEVENRMGKVPYDPRMRVDTWWDLGMDDATAIWFTQTFFNEVRIIDYFEQSGEGLPFYAKYLQSLPYVYGAHNAPHDIAVRELGTGKSRIETAAELGIKFETVPNLDLSDGIEATRSFISKCWFDLEKCKVGIDALKNYHKEYDEKRKIFKNRPFHDWSSHGADSFRYLAVGHERAANRRNIQPQQKPKNMARL